MYPRSNSSVQLNHRVVVGGFVGCTVRDIKYGENRPEDELFCQKPASKKGGDSELKHDRELLMILLSVIGSVFVALMVTYGTR